MSESLLLGKKVFFGDNIFDCIIVGSGAAAFNAALHLYDRGVTNIVLITENPLWGTSRNTGSDKQTYYKIACSGDQADSPRAMAETLFAGASMDGDIALCEASHSLQEFFHLVSIGVDFPHNLYGEYVGYKTDHDPFQRASSIGPYTSKKMTEKLESEVLKRNISIMEKIRAVKLLTDTETKRAYGLVSLEAHENFRVFFAKNIVFATGGNPLMYHNTVYPLSQTGASGILAREGISFANMTEWQYGIASIKFRWNLSGSYQQVIPRYVSVDENGNEEEFLFDYFTSHQDALRAVFLKGYEWPFDPGKIAGQGSSTVDLAIYIEKHIKKKRIFLDYTHNPKGFSLDEIDKTAYQYLAKSNALSASPIERLLKLNAPAYELYKSNGIDLAKEYLEIDVVPQHHNGGVEVDIWWESSVKHTFAIGECAGTHGVHRPGGSALNSGQVGGCRAAYRIASTLKDDSFFAVSDIQKKAEITIEKFNNEFANVHRNKEGNKKVSELLTILQEINSRCAACIRPKDEIAKNIKTIASIADELLEIPDNIDELFTFNEIVLISRLMYDAIDVFTKNGGKSRGSYLVLDSIKNIKDYLKGAEIDTQFRDKVLSTAFMPDQGHVASIFRQVRPIPESDTWFEQVWYEYREGKFFK